MAENEQPKKSRLPAIAAAATYFGCGVMISQWASLVPFAKVRPGLSDLDFGLVLPAFALGALVCLPVSAVASSRWGCRWPLATACAAGLPALFVLASTTNPVLFIAALVLFGGAVGAFDVVMNLVGGMNEKFYGQTMQPLFHGIYNIGGVIGSLGVSALLSFGLSAGLVVPAIAVALGALFFACCRFWPGAEPPVPGQKKPPLFAMPTPALALVACLACAFYVAEGVVQDWGALFLVESRGLPSEYSGLGFGAFMAAMAIMRIVGGKAADIFGLRLTLLLSGVVTSLAMLGLWIIPNPWACLGLFVVTAIGLANVIPLLFSQAARTRGMPTAVAVSTVTTIGYAGVLVGPKLLGLASKSTGLPAIFLAVGIISCMATLTIFLKRSFGR